MAYACAEVARSRRHRNDALDKRVFMLILVKVCHGRLSLGQIKLPDAEVCGPHASLIANLFEPRSAHGPTSVAIRVGLAARITSRRRTASNPGGLSSKVLLEQKQTRGAIHTHLLAPPVSPSNPGIASGSNAASLAARLFSLRRQAASEVSKNEPFSFEVEGR